MYGVNDQIQQTESDRVRELYAKEKFWCSELCRISSGDEDGAALLGVLMRCTATVS